MKVNIDRLIEFASKKLPQSDHLLLYGKLNRSI